MTTKARNAPKPNIDDDVPEWAMPATEGDAGISAGKEVEAAEAVIMPTADEIMQNLMEWCVAYQEAHAADSAAVMAAEVARILAGEDAEAVLSERAPLNGKDHVGKSFMLRSFTLNETDFSEGWPFFASMDCELPGTGDRFVMNCGGVKVIAALRRLYELGEFPYLVQVKGNDTKAGRTVLSLIMPGL